MRQRCARCRNPRVTCYCSQVIPFAPAIRFVLLVHPEEARRTIATARMAHLCLPNSVFLEGVDFTGDDRLNEIVNADRPPFLLYPGREATNLSNQPSPVQPGDHVIVLDGTWAQARKIRRLSRNLRGLPQVAFTPRRPSAFWVRQQPRSECYSTVEAIHEMIRLTDPDSESAAQTLLNAFNFLVRQQMLHEETHKVLRGFRPTRAPCV